MRWALVLAALLAPAAQAYAACSQYHGQATINEFYQSGNEYFAEVKILDPAIAASVYANWTLSLCSSGNGCSQARLGGSGVDRSGYPWIVVNSMDDPGRRYFEFSKGLDALLTDQDGNTIDYVSIGGLQQQRDASCASAYPWQVPSNNSHNPYRSPDGIGDWVWQPGSSGSGPTDGAPNDDSVPPVSCPLARFEISQTAYALACPDTRAVVTIQARCADGGLKTDYTGVVDLTANAAGAAFFTAATGGNPISSVAFQPGDGGSKDVYLYYNNEHPSLRVTATDQITGSAGTAATGTDFGVAGFLAQAPGAVVCTGSNGPFTTATLTAYGQREDNPGCGVLSNFDGLKDLKMWFRYLEPGSNPAGSRVWSAQAGGALPTSEPAGSNAAIEFRGGIGEFNFRYGDAGKLELLVKHESPRYDGDPHAPVEAKAGSGVVVVHPDRFAVSATHAGVPLAATIADDFDHAPTHVAASPFRLDVAAQCVDGSAARNYRPTADNDRLLTYVERTGPVPVGVEGKLTLTPTTVIDSRLAAPADTADYHPVILPAADFDEGVYRFDDARYSEVGLIRLYLQDSNYHGQVIDAAPLDIGRFIPRRIVMRAPLPAEPDGPTLGNVDQAGGYTYLGHNDEVGGMRIGEPLPWAAPPVVSVQPVNADGVLTRNYRGAFWRLAEAPVARTYQSTAAGTAGLFSYTPVLVERKENEFPDEAGRWVFRDQLRYQRPGSPVVPFEAEIRLSLWPQELDEVEVCYQPDGSAGCSELVIEGIAGARLRYGQGFAQNSAGTPGRLGDRLAIPLRAAYYGSSGRWLTNTDDASTAVKAAVRAAPNPELAVHLDPGMPPDPADLASPKQEENVSLAMGRGAVGVSIAVDVNAHGKKKVLDLEWPPWLDGAATATATFGLYHGDRRFLYWLIDGRADAE